MGSVLLHSILIPHNVSMMLDGNNVDSSSFLVCFTVSRASFTSCYVTWSVEDGMALASILLLEEEYADDNGVNNTKDACGTLTGKNLAPRFLSLLLPVSSAPFKKSRVNTLLMNFITQLHQLNLCHRRNPFMAFNQSTSASPKVQFPRNIAVRRSGAVIVFLFFGLGTMGLS